MPVVTSEFRPAWWLPGAHAQTLWPRFAPGPPVPVAEHQRLETPDGDFIDLAWFGPGTGKIVLMLHGLEGTLDSHYAATLICALTAAGYRCCFMHFRGCSGEPNRLARSYHSGETGDPAWVAAQIGENGHRLYAVLGVSLGGNVLLKWLGETGSDAPCETAVAISVPFDLDACARRLERGLSRLYQWHLVTSLQQKYRAKFTDLPSPLDVDPEALNTFRRFDDRITAPLHGFRDVDDYYGRSSCRQYLDRVAVPTLIVHSRDDPFMVPAAIPTAAELSPEVTLELSDRGGHVGFITGRWPWRPGYWLATRVVDWLAQAAAVNAPPTTDPIAAERHPAPAP